MAYEQDLAQLCKALAHPIRVQILKILLQRGRCICGDLSDELPLAPSTISEHLRILKEAGLITGTIDGQKRCYRFNEAVLEQFKTLVMALVKETP